MTYREMVEIVKEKMEKGEPLHGLARDIAIDLLLEKEDRKEAK